MKIVHLGLAAAVAALASLNVHATIMAQVGAGSFDSVTASENFEGFAALDYPSNPFTSGGFTFGQSDTANGFIIWGASGTVGFPTQSLYQNGGSLSLLSILMADASDINQIVFDVGNGFGPLDPQHIWLRTYNNNVATGFDFDFDITVPSSLSVWTDGGTTFDEIRVGAYFSSNERDSHLETNSSAVSVDNVIAGVRAGSASVPAPSVLALFGIGLVGLGWSRRKPML